MYTLIHEERTSIYPWTSRENLGQNALCVIILLALPVHPPPPVERPKDITDRYKPGIWWKELLWLNICKFILWICIQLLRVTITWAFFKQSKKKLSILINIYANMSSYLCSYIFIPVQGTDTCNNLHLFICWFVNNWRPVAGNGLECSCLKLFRRHRLLPPPLCSLAKNLAVVQCYCHGAAGRGNHGCLFVTRKWHGQCCHVSGVHQQQLSSLNKYDNSLVLLVSKWNSFMGYYFTNCNIQQEKNSPKIFYVEAINHTTIAFLKFLKYQPLSDSNNKRPRGLDTCWNVAEVTFHPSAAWYIFLKFDISPDKNSPYPPPHTHTHTLKLLYFL